VRRLAAATRGLTEENEGNPALTELNVELRYKNSIIKVSILRSAMIVVLRLVR